MSYATPTDLWRLSLSPINLFGEKSLRPGAWSDVSRDLGTGLGTVEVDADSTPLDGWDIDVKVSRAGELAVPGLLSLASPPRVKVAMDAGPWSAAYTPDDLGRVELADYGLVLQLRNGAQGAAVTYGDLTVRAKHYGLRLAIAIGTALRTTYDAETGLITLTVASGTTAPEAAVYLMSSGLPIYATSTGSSTLSAATAALPYASFLVGDQWSVTTTASPDALDALAVASDLMDGYFRATYTLPLASTGAMVRQVCCNLARWQIVTRKGLHTDARYQPYEPKTEMAWLADVQRGHIVLTATETVPTESFADQVPRIDPLSYDAGAAPI